MLEEINYWLSLMQSGEYEMLEEELKEMQVSLLPSMEPEEIPDYSLDEAFDIAEGYRND